MPSLSMKAFLVLVVYLVGRLAFNMSLLFTTDDVPGAVELTPDMCTRVPTPEGRSASTEVNSSNEFCFSFFSFYFFVAECDEFRG